MVQKDACKLFTIVSRPQNVERTQSLISTIHTFMSTREQINIDCHPQEICPAKSVLLAKIRCVSMAFFSSSLTSPNSMVSAQMTSIPTSCCIFSQINARMEVASSVLDLVNMGLLISSRGSAYLNFSSLVSGSIRIFIHGNLRGQWRPPNANTPPEISPQQGIMVVKNPMIIP